MEALWNLEDKWKLSMTKAIALCACTSFLMICICLVGVLKRRKSMRILHQAPCKYKKTSAASWPDPTLSQGRCSVANVLKGSVRWSGPDKWKEGLMRVSGRDIPTPMLARDVERQSHDSTSAVWQRPILMGEKCELPRFSGLILYDERGIPLHQCEEVTIDSQVTL